MNNKGKSVVVREGARLYKQKKSSIWWLSVRHDGEEVRCSTGVKIDDDPEGTGLARDKAIELIVEAQVKIKLGLNQPSSPTFKVVADQTIAHLDSLTPQKAIYASYKRVITNYLKPYFGKISINKVNRHELFKFFEWRKEQTSGGISLTQKRVTSKALWHIFNLACNHGHIEQHLIPELPSVQPKAKKRREFFTEEQLEKILHSFPDFIKQSRNRKTREIREKLECYVSFLLGTGARPGEEVSNITFGDISFRRDRKSLTWLARIKKGKNSERKGERQIVLGHRAVEALKQLIALNPMFAGLQLSDVVSKYPMRKILSVSYRDDLPDFSRPFGHYMAYLGYKDGKYTLYSLRHTYITHRLLAGDVPRRAIAKQCGNSEEVIEEYYDHVISLDYANELKAGDSFRGIAQPTLEEFMK